MPGPGCSPAVAAVRRTRNGVVGLGLPRIQLTGLAARARAVSFWAREDLVDSGTVGMGSSPALRRVLRQALAGWIHFC
ncbi:hypothetical protein [Streptomyces sp. NPDC002671]